MCGIFGAPVLTDCVKAMLPYLGIAMQSRGRDAWGASNGEQVIKHVGELVETWADSWADIIDWNAGIFHTRGASHGSAKVLDNAHPFEYRRADGDRIIGIHNGVVTNHDALDKKYGRTCAVDSMHIWMHRAAELPWSDIEGWGNLAWWETNAKGQRVIHVARFNSTDLHVVQLEQGELVFASELAPIRTIAKMFGNPIKTNWIIDEYRRYSFAPNDDGIMTIWRDEQRLPFPERYSYAGAAWEGYGCGYTAPTNTRKNLPVVPPMAGGDTVCAKCGLARVESKHQLVCTGCFGELVTDFYKWLPRQEGAEYVN